MDAREALVVLGLDEGSDLVALRRAYRRLVRVHHPDVSGGGRRAHEDTARVIEAYTSLVAWLDREGVSVVRLTPAPAGADRPDADAGPIAPTDPPVPARSPQDATQRLRGDDVATMADEDTILLEVPAAEAYPLLAEAAGRIGDVAYVDAELGILEIIVRFEGGPSCSVVMTLQGRAWGTEVFCTMESIEAAPTPSLTPVIEALVDELSAP